MRIDNKNFSAINQSASKSIRVVVAMSFDDDNTDQVYFTSHINTETPEGSTVISNVVRGYSGLSQKINPDQGNSTIGGFSFSIIDKESAITEKVRDKLNAGYGLRHKRVIAYVGYEDLLWSEYSQTLTYIIDEPSYIDGAYTFECLDIQRIAKKNIFEPEVANLTESVTDSQNYIPVNAATPALFPTVLHDSSYSDRPGENVSYIRLEKEIIAHSGIFVHSDAGNSYQVVERGALNTLAVSHVIDPNVSDNRKLKITEHIFLAGAAPKVAYQVMTGHVAENLITYSEQIDNAAWNKVQASIVANAAIAPDGTITADRLDVTASNNAHYADTNGVTVTASEYHTYSKFIKDDGEQYAFISLYQSGTNCVCAVFDLATGELTDTSELTSSIKHYGIVDYGGGWFRLYITANLGAYTTIYGIAGAAGDAEPTYSSGLPSFLAVAGEDLFLWGAQLSQTNYLIPYFKTVDSAQAKQTLPDNWHLGMSLDDVRLENFTRLDNDLWNQFDDTGRHVRFEGHKKIDGKKFIEKEIMYWMAAFMPIYSNGQIGVKRLSPILSDSAYVAVLDDTNVVSYTRLKHGYKSVINKMIVDWNYNFQKEGFTKTSALTDEGSISKHKLAPVKEIELRGVHTASHTDEDILSYFDSMRDRYSGPPLLLSLTVLHSLNELEVGDVVKVNLEQIRDFTATSGVALNRAFEIQQVTTDWLAGNVNLTLFGSSQKAGELVRSTLSAVLDDDFYGWTGTHDGAGNAAVLEDTTESWEVDALVGLNIFNITDGSSSVITANTATTVTGVLSGGADNDWDVSDIYSIGKGTDLRVPLTISGNAITANGSLAGGDTMAEGVYYYIGNLTHNAGVTVSFTKNVELRVKGHLTLNGKEDGKGGGHAGGAGGSTFDDGSTTVDYLTKYDYLTLNNTNTESGVEGYGVTQGSGSFAITESKYGAHRTFSASGHMITGAPSLFFSSIANFSTFLSGDPVNLMGSSGSGGFPILRHEDSIYSHVHAAGGAGGAGGAGLKIISRGGSFGVSAEIDVSGDDGSIGTPYAYSGVEFYAGSGGGGAPGAVSWLIDGNQTIPELATYLTANHGDTPIAGERFPKGGVFHQRYNKAVNRSYSEGVGAYSSPLSSSRIQYLPPYDAAAYEQINQVILSGAFLQSWTQRQTPSSSTETCRVVVHGNDQFLMAMDSYVYVSSNGHNWTSYALPSTFARGGAAYGNGVWLVVNSTCSATVAGSRSTDGGATWSNFDIGSSAGDAWRHVEFIDGLFYVAGRSATSSNYNVQTSTDGLSWSPVTSYPAGAASFCRHMVYGGGLFVTVHANGEIVSSPDGQTWTQRITVPYASGGGFPEIAYGNGVWVVVYKYNTFGADEGIYTSTDLETWTARDNPLKADLNTVVFGEGIFVAAGTNADGLVHIISSIDGSLWDTVQIDPDSGTGAVSRAGFGKKRFVITGSYTGATYNQLCLTSPVIYPEGS